MKRLLITLILVSPFSFADWGDVYYCQMTNLVDTDIDGTVKRYKLEKFQFKLDEEKKAMVFGKSGFFNGSVKPLAREDVFLNQEYWFARDLFYILKYHQGEFEYVILANEITSITANCDKF